MLYRKQAALFGEEAGLLFIEAGLLFIEAGLLFIEAGLLFIVGLTRSVVHVVWLLLGQSSHDNCVSF